jgi:predicted dehydrogenase
MIKVGVIGYGYWGPNLVRNFMETDGMTVTMVADLSEANLAKVRSRYPTVHTTRDHNDLFRSTDVDAVAIATPVSTHYDLAMAAVRAGKHVFVEKPMTQTSVQAKKLVAAVARHKRVLMVDHTFIYTGAVRKMRELVAKSDLGEIYYYDSVRVNLGLFQHDVNVIWDLAVHDLTIMDFVLGRFPKVVSATGTGHIEGQPEDVAYMTMLFDDALIAHVHVNWLAPVKVRYTLIGGSKKMIVYNDLEPSEKIKIYDKGVTIEKRPEAVYQMKVGYRVGDMWAPQLDPREALRVEAAEFARCIREQTQPINDVKAGLRIVQLLEAANKSLHLHGKPIQLKEY